MTQLSQPIIGIVPSFDEGNVISGGHGKIKRLYLRRDYLEIIASVGAVPLIINPAMSLDWIMANCVGIVISGGHDIDPKFYNEKALPEIRLREPGERHKWESKIIQACDEADKPILGICYGLQRLNVHYGGSLIQDISREYGMEVDHDDTKHEVSFTESFLGIKAGARQTVASRHHQALARLADCAHVVAQADDGIVEAATFGRHLGMQWHPESDVTGIHVYRAFVEYCMKS
jgi:putative glutamine amidotransferase